MRGFMRRIDTIQSHYRLVAALLMAPLPICAQSVQIGYSNCVEVASYPDSVMQDAGKLRWFFAHASVGNNMMDGIDALHVEDPTRYPYHRVWEDEVPPNSTSDGALYAFWRGNPGWVVKFDSFAGYLSNGWCYPKVNLVANKLCFVDQDASLEYYISSMTNLEAAFPETLLVYMTMPLMTTTDENNVKRNVYNQELRAWTKANDRVLFDVADIEAHDTNGSPCLFTNNDQTYQRLSESYVAPGDDGHLNPEGKRLVALGFYALAAALFSIDRDKDGMMDGQELIAGTRPMDRSSVLRLQASLARRKTILLSWQSATNRMYTLQRASNFGGFTDLAEVIATPPTNFYKDTPGTPGPFFYRVVPRQLP